MTWLKGTGCCYCSLFIDYCREDRDRHSDGEQKKIMSRPALFKIMHYKDSADRFLKVDSVTVLADLLRVREEKLREWALQPKYAPLYHQKKNGELRVIYAPDPDLKRIQKRLSRFLEDVYLIHGHSSAYGFVPSRPEAPRGIVANASLHCGRQYLLNLDLKDFFPSIRSLQVYNLLQTDPFNFNPETAYILAGLTTLQTRLPQGAPTSPILSNFICLNLDKKLSNWSAKREGVYSRYADDLSFSSDARFTVHDLADLRSIIAEEGFRVNEKKTRMNSAGSAQKVTGLLVNEKVNVDRRYIRRLRAILHNIGKNGFYQEGRQYESQCKFIQVLRGKIEFVGMVRGKEDRVYLKLLGELGRLPSTILFHQSLRSNEKE